MTTIDTNMSLVMIDPNEPLELYDGTIIKGRLEWFLYALCCLDYGNLPTPLSRIEEWANALITNELPNMEPQSRAEEFFKAILTGDTSNLPTPQSRSEVLLDKLARGENDFTNVEKIQSRYEFLLAYLIKNGGGIGNIDYVLYKFQKEDETLYNTKERPVKSAILSGQTLVNFIKNKYNHCNLPTSQDVVVDGANTIFDSPEYRIKQVDFTMPLTVGKEYLISINVKSMENVNYLGVYVYDGTSTTYPAELRPTKIGLNVVKYTPTSPIKQMAYYVDAENGKRATLGQPMIIEYQEGMENWNIPYFEGMQSVKMPVLTTVGKNLFDGVSYIDGFITSGNNYTVSYDTDVTSILVNVNKNTDYTLSAKTSFNRNMIGGSLEPITIGAKTTKIEPSLISSNILKFNSGDYTNIIIYLNNTKIDIEELQVEEGSVSTPYEPYKSNILTTTSKNLFNMNRPYDNLTDSQATVVQDTDQITVSSSAESGAYVNANFILDKDFFAGKTVTGSCLYESDEKDIGTVQIVYQDGNGEHHYQWIRTPKTFTFPNSFIGDVTLSVYANNTGTPQSNTVTVKNIQLELGSTATPYEPYSEGVTLRGIGEVKDGLDCLTGEVTERVGEVVLDGNEDWTVMNYQPNENGTHYQFHYWLGENLIGGNLWENDKSILVDILPTASGSLHWQGIGEYGIGGDRSFFMITWRKDSCPFNDVVTLKQWLSENPVTVQYQLANEQIKTVDLSIVDQGGATIPKLNTFDKITHVNVSATDILPGEVEMEVATTVGEDLSGTLYSTMEDIETKQEALKESNNAQTESVNSTMMATTEIYESLL